MFPYCMRICIVYIYVCICIRVAYVSSINMIPATDPQRATEILTIHHYKDYEKLHASVYHQVWLIKSIL